MAREQEGEFEQSAWNLSQHDIILMASLWSRATSQSLNGLTLDCFYTTKEIRFLIHTDTTKEEDIHLDKLEKNIQRLSPYILRGNRKALRLLGDGLIEYKKYIRELLGKYGYLFSKKQDNARMY